jgi:hypothetical protein
MEIVIVSFLVFVVSAAALAAGQWFGREPIVGGCRPGESSGPCANSATCRLPCASRRQKRASGESR